jgi:hypothetical protein
MLGSLAEPGWLANLASPDLPSWERTGVLAVASTPVAVALVLGAYC